MFGHPVLWVRNQRMNAPEDRGPGPLLQWAGGGLLGGTDARQASARSGNIISESGSVLSLMGSNKRVPILQ